MQNLKVLSNEELVQVSGEGIFYLVGRLTIKAYEGFTYIYS